MSVSTAYSVLDYSGNGSTTAFSVTWPFFDGTLIVSEIVNSTGVETVKVLNSDYTVTGGTDDDGLPATGTVTMAVAPASGRTLRIKRSTPFTQATAWAAFDAFPQKTAEGSFDKALLLAQELYAATALGLVDTPFSTYWDATGEVISNVGTPVADDDAATKEYVDDLVALFDDASISIGTVTTGAAGSSASASLTGTFPAYTLNLTIPRGNAGATGAGTGDLLAANNLSDVDSAATSRTNLGLGTGNSPQFTGVNIGSSDTTLTRVSPGVFAVAGVNVLTVAGGSLTGRLTSSNGATTGNSAMATATTQLGELEVRNNSTGAAMMAFHRVGVSAGYLGLDTDNVLKWGGWTNGANAYTIFHSGNNASAANFLANTASVGALTPNAVWSAAAPVTLTDAATISVDMSTFVNAVVTLGGNRTLGNPSNAKAGQSGIILIKQDATGSRTLAYSSNWYFPADTAPTLSTTANYVDKLFYFVESASIIHAELVQDSR